MSHDTKTTIKEARQAYKENNYTDAIIKCKTILNTEQNNYKALTLLAAAMLKVGEYKSEIPLILQKAIQIETNNLIAWYGLISYYTKYLDDNDSYNKLILIYCKLLRLESDTQFSSILNKISELSLQVKDVPTLIQCVEYLRELRKELDQNKLKMIDKTLGWILIDNFNNLDKYTNLLESVFKSVINDLNTVDQKNFYTKYLKVLYNKGELIVLIKEAINIHQQFPQDILPLGKY
ncbi:Tetratricopeptide repeat protein 37 [Eufriesea mexicana]|nr:Tetratricopeptide repeat protein 37 [Eufriesea mexicana]